MPKAADHVCSARLTRHDLPDVKRPCVSHFLMPDPVSFASRFILDGQARFDPIRLKSGMAGIPERASAGLLHLFRVQSLPEPFRNV